MTLWNMYILWRCDIHIWKHEFAWRLDISQMNTFQQPPEKNGQQRAAQFSCVAAPVDRLMRKWEKVFPLSDGMLGKVSGCWSWIVLHLHGASVLLVASHQRSQSSIWGDSMISLCCFLLAAFTAQSWIVSSLACSLVYSLSPKRLWFLWVQYKQTSFSKRDQTSQSTRGRSASDYFSQRQYKAILRYSSYILLDEQLPCGVTGGEKM